MRYKADCFSEITKNAITKHRNPRTIDYIFNATASEKNSRSIGWFELSPNPLEITTGLSAGEFVGGCSSWL